MYRHDSVNYSSSYRVFQSKALYRLNRKLILFIRRFARIIVFSDARFLSALFVSAVVFFFSPQPTARRFDTRRPEWQMFNVIAEQVLFRVKYVPDGRAGCTRTVKKIVRPNINVYVSTRHRKCITQNRWIPLTPPPESQSDQKCNDCAKALWAPAKNAHPEKKKRKIHRNTPCYSTRISSTIFAWHRNNGNVTRTAANKRMREIAPAVNTMLSHVTRSSWFP